MFNLGYLPGGDKTKITQSRSTIAGLSTAGSLLSGGGVLTVMCYPGHDGGADEVAKVNEFVHALDIDQWSVSLYLRREATDESPYLWVVNKNSAKTLSS